MQKARVTRTRAAVLPTTSTGPPPRPKGWFRLRNVIFCILSLACGLGAFVVSRVSSNAEALAPEALVHNPFVRHSIKIDPNARGWTQPGRKAGVAQSFRALEGAGGDTLHRNLIFDPTRLAPGAEEAGTVSAPDADLVHERVPDIDPNCGHGGRCWNEPQAPHEEHKHAGHALNPNDPHAADLAAHRSPENGECWEHFDLGALEAWDAAAVMHCIPHEGWAPGAPEEGEITERIGARYRSDVDVAGAPPAEATAIADEYLRRNVNGEGRGGWLRCRVHTDSHLPPATAPHTLCDGANIALDVARLVPTACLPSRPGYKCDGPPIHWTYPEGSLTAACARRPALVPDAFPRDHLRDMFAGWTAVDAGAAWPPAGAVEAPAPVVLVMARERGEHANLFHASSDWLNAFVSLSIAGHVDSRTGARVHMKDVQLLLLDEQTGPFEDGFLRPVFSPAHPVLRVSALKRATTGGTPPPPLLMRRALFVPPGYSSLLLSHVTTEGDCHAATQLFTAFRAFTLEGMGISRDTIDAKKRGAAADAASMKVRVTLISRRPYSAAGIDHPFMGRQIANEDALIAALTALDGIEVARIDFALLTVAEQVALVAERTDVLVGMHGAALSYALLLPPWAAVLELWPKPTDMWRCFEHLSTMTGVFYERWANADNSAFREDEKGDYLTLPTADVAAKVADLASKVRGKW